MSSFYTVVYDACVLYPAPLRSLLIHMAITDLFRARWSDLIHEEWICNLLDSAASARTPCVLHPYNISSKV